MGCLDKFTASLSPSSCSQDHPLLCTAGPAHRLPHMRGSRTLCQRGHRAQVLLPLHGGEPHGCELLPLPV